MRTQEHQALVQRHADFVNTGDERIVDDLFAEDYVQHAATSDVPGRASQKQAIANFRAGFPDWRVRVDEVYSDGEHVIYRWTAQGTRQGPFESRAAGRTLAPTGKKATLNGVHIQRVAGGRFVEGWAVQDTLSFLQQLGALPTSG